MRDALGMLVYTISGFSLLFDKLYITIEFQLQQHKRERGDLKRTNT